MKDEYTTIYCIVLNYNGYNDTKNCILSLKKQNYKNVKIVIVDNCSPDNSGQELQKVFPDEKFLFSNENKGYAHGMNIGIRYALEQKAPYILLSNNDVLFSPDFLNPLMKVLQDNDNAGIASPKILYLNDKHTIYCAGADFNIWLCGVHNPLKGKPAAGNGIEKREITFAEGSTLLCKREVFEKAGFISEKYFMYFEDLDFSREVIKYFKIWYIPESIVYHKGGAGQTWSNYSPLYFYYNNRNRLLFFKNYNFIIQLYAILFTLLNSVAKTLILIKNLINGVEVNKTKSAIKSIWKGLFSGIKLIVT